MHQQTFQNGKAFQLIRRAVEMVRQVAASKTPMATTQAKAKAKALSMSQLYPLLAETRVRLRAVFAVDPAKEGQEPWPPPVGCTHTHSHS